MGLGPKREGRAAGLSWSQSALSAVCGLNNS